MFPMDSPLSPREKVKYLSQLMQAGVREEAADYRKERYDFYIKHEATMSEASYRAWEDVIQRWPLHVLVTLVEEQRAIADMEAEMKASAEARDELYRKKKMEKKKVNKRTKAYRQAQEHVKRLQDWEQQYKTVDLSVYDLPTEVAFALHNMGKMPDPDDESTWDIAPMDAPSPGAWHLLWYAVNNKQKFMERVMAEQIAMHKEKKKNALKNNAVEEEQVTDETEQDDGLDRLAQLFGDNKE